MIIILTPSDLKANLSAHDAIGLEHFNSIIFDCSKYADLVLYIHMNGGKILKSRSDEYFNNELINDEKVETIIFNEVNKTIN